MVEKTDFCVDAEVMEEIIDLIFEVEFAREIFDVLFPGITKEELEEMIRMRNGNRQGIPADKVIKVVMFLVMCKDYSNSLESMSEEIDSRQKKKVVFH